MPILALLVLSFLSAAAPAEWRDSIRDVHVDGKLDRNAQVLTSSSPRMLAVVCGDEVLLLDPESQAVSRVPKAAFAFQPDRTSAMHTPLIPAEAAGSLARTGSTFIATLEGANGVNSVVVAPHQSKPGPMTIEELWETAPVWRAIADVYEPDGAIVERLRAIDEPVQLEIVLATWCGDSRQHVPRLLKSIAEAANPNITVQLVGIDSDFVEPADVVAAKNVTNVPTVIVRGGGEELGRFVETPANGTVEDDVCDIVEGTVKAHPGRLQRGALLASGKYVLRDARRRVEGTETFELYEKPGGGVVAHSVITKRDGTSVETWAHEKYVEVTHRAARTTRTRYRRDGDRWSANSRGAHGIIEQVVTAPAAFVAPATVTYAWARDAKSVYVVPESGAGSIATIDARVDDGTVPRSVRFSDGSSRTLVAATPAPLSW